MLQFIAQQNVLLYGVAVIGILGIASQIILRSIYERLIRDMENVHVPKGKFMKQLKRRYESSGQKKEGIANVDVFVRKSIMEYQCIGLSLHSWRRLGGIALLLCVAFGMSGYYLTGLAKLAAEMRQNYLLATLAAGLFIAGVYGLTDIGYRKRYLETGLEDLLTNMKMDKLGLEQSFDFTRPERPERTVTAEKVELSSRVALKPRRKRGNISETQAQRDKRELKENLAKLKEGISETAAAGEHNKERNTEILKQMDPAEQERAIREVLKEFLS